MVVIDLPEALIDIEPHPNGSVESRLFRFPTDRSGYRIVRDVHETEAEPVGLTNARRHPEVKLRHDQVEGTCWVGEIKGERVDVRHIGKDGRMRQPEEVSVGPPG